MQITDREVATLNFYRASELYGGLLLGHMVRRTRDPELVLELTRHSAEEVTHAQLWTETILAVGGRIRPVRTAYQTRFAEQIGRPSTMLHVLAATQVFERRVYRHFLEHLGRPGTHPEIQTTLQRMIQEEKHHLSWVKEWLDRQATRRADEVEGILRRYVEADERVYGSFLAEYGWRRAA
jgi:hypothetical protein